MGSSTLVVMTIDDKECKVHAAYVGDSGYIIYRIENSLVKKIFEYEE